MSPLNDDKLKQLEKEMKSTDEYEGCTYVDNVTLGTLIARIRAAEKIAKWYSEIHPDDSWSQEWKEAVKK